ncbi:MAG: M23 family metallopeptidase, partial [Chloroflexota bacterium]
MDIAPCGYVDGFDLPVPDVDIERTDFAIYRARFGGLHTGVDLAFEQLGEPVRAAARGQVTFSDPEGWDTEKGVVVVQHTLPDGTLVNTLYGHMEELNGHVFPQMGQCVERGDIVGAIGFPSRGRPHLHYEVRTRYRHEGGPGYTVQNPLELGWLHPVDFTFLANLWVHPAYRWHFTLTDPLTLPPLPLEDGTYMVANSAHVQAVAASGAVIWQFDTLG